MTGSLSIVAKRGSFEEFLEVYRPCDAAWSSPSTGQPLLLFALAHKDVPTRITIATRILDDGADPAAVAPRTGMTVLHVLFGARRHDFALERSLIERLIEGGADLNRVVARFGTPLETLALERDFDDDRLAPLYDVVFARPGLDVQQMSVFGRSVIDNVRAVGHRAALVTRMERYLASLGDD